MKTKLAWLLLLSVSLISQTVPSADVDLSRSGTNPAETLLTPSNVAVPGFRKLASWPVDGYVFAQPLYLPGISISGSSRDLVIVATLNNSVYAFDAVSGATVWSNLQFATPYASYPVAEGGFYGQSLGCISTPVADVAALKLYVVCENSTPNWILRQLSLTTGATLQTATISGQVIGTGDTGHGDTTSGSNLLFYPRYQFQRASLAVANGNVYIGFAALNDTRPWHGWLMAYRTSDLSEVGIWCATPNGYGGGIWMSGGAPAVDGSGNIYVTTGNGTAYDGVSSFTDSVIKLSPTLAMLDWFTPSNNASIDAADGDTSSNRVILAATKAIASGKDFNVYVLDTGCMGELQGSSACSLQTFPTNSKGSVGNTTGAYGGAMIGNLLVLPTTAGSLYTFQFSGSTFNATPMATQTNSYGFPGPAQLAGSGTGANAILWVTTTATGTHTTVQAGTLRAIAPSTLTELWDSDQSGTDSLGNITKFAAPTVGGGRVYVPTQSGEIQVYGLADGSTVDGQVAISGSVTMN
jgi:hypothetical protein